MSSLLRVLRDLHAFCPLQWYVGQPIVKAFFAGKNVFIKIRTQVCRGTTRLNDYSCTILELDISGNLPKISRKKRNETSP